MKNARKSFQQVTLDTLIYACIGFTLMYGWYTWVDHVQQPPIERMLIGAYWGSFIANMFINYVIRPKDTKDNIDEPVA